MARRIKTGRKAGADDRARAARWVKLYRLAQANPDGRYCLNPQDELECQAFIDEADPEPLLLALESFVEHGTFAVMHDLEPLLLRMEMNALQSDGMTYEVAIEHLAKVQKISESSIARRIRRTVKT
jgi:hypothetical protein